MPPERAREVAHLLATGVWTHDHPLQAPELLALGLPVRVGVPEAERELMTLYPQPRGRTPAVEYVPGPPAPPFPRGRRCRARRPRGNCGRPRALAPAVAVPAGRPGGREVDQRADRGVAVVGRAPDEPAVATSGPSTSGSATTPGCGRPSAHRRGDRDDRRPRATTSSPCSAFCTSSSVRVAGAPRCSSSVQNALHSGSTFGPPGNGWSIASATASSPRPASGWPAPMTTTIGLWSSVSARVPASAGGWRNRPMSAPSSIERPGAMKSTACHASATSGRSSRKTWEQGTPPCVRQARVVGDGEPAHRPRVVGEPPRKRPSLRLPLRGRARGDGARLSSRGPGGTERQGTPPPPVASRTARRGAKRPGRSSTRVARQAGWSRSGPSGLSVSGPGGTLGISAEPEAATDHADRRHRIIRPGPHAAAGSDRGAGPGRGARGRARRRPARPLAEPVSAEVTWEVPVVSDPLAAEARHGDDRRRPRADGARRLGPRRRADRRALRIGRRPVVADASATHGVGLVPLPALGRSSCDGGRVTRSRGSSTA